jgi:hypothetical protein
MSDESMVVDVSDYWWQQISDEAWGGCGESILFCNQVTGGSHSDATTGGSHSDATTGGSHSDATTGGAESPCDIKKTSECTLGKPGPCADAAAIDVVKKYIGVSETVKPVDVISMAKKETKCDTEECALRKVADEVSSREAKIIFATIRDNFKPNGPADSTKWLNNENIDQVLDQIELRHPNLYHMNFHMIDFKEANAPLWQLNMHEDVIAKGYTMFAVVMNTDTYGKSGSHWFCIFADFRTAGTAQDPYTIEYFNSSGAPASKEIHEWEVKTIKNLSDHDKNCIFVNATPIRHQRGKSECGVYCLCYLYERIKGSPISMFAEPIHDERMESFRTTLFRNRESNPAT